MTDPHPTIWPEDPFHLKTVSESGDPPKSRVDNAQDAFDIVQELIWANRARDDEDRMIQNMDDGNPPYNSSKLKAAGQSRRANFSTLEFPAQASAGCAPYYDLFATGRHYAVIECEGQNDKKETWSHIITEEFDTLLERWVSFDFMIWTMINDFMKFGKGFLMWQDTLDWRFRRIAHHRILVPDGTECEIDDELEMFVVRQNMKVHQLYNRVRNKGSAESLGWKHDECMKAIRRAVPRQIETEDVMELQKQLHDHDLSTSIKVPSIQVAHLFVREFNNKWSHFIVEEDRQSYSTDKKSDFLFKKLNRFEEPSQIIAPFFFEVKNGSWHGSTGLGRALRDIMRIKDRSRCAQLDALFLRLGVTLQAKTAAALQKQGITHMGGGYHVVGPDFDIQQSTVLGDIESSIVINRDLDAMLESNTGIYRPRLDPKPGNPMTLGEFQQRMSMASVLGNSAVNRFYSSLDRPYQEMYKRASNPSLTKSMGKGAEMALEFQMRCVARGVPREWLRKIESIKADRNMGNGSSTMRQQALGALGQFFPMMPEDGRANFIDDVISVYTNESKVDRYNPKGEMTNQDNVIAMLQVSSMHDGVPPVVESSQNPVVFAQTFLQAGAQALASLQQGGNPHEVLSFLDLDGPAIAAHLKRLEIDPSRKDALKALTEQWKQLGQQTDKLKQMLQQQAEQQQKQQQEAMQAQQQAQAIQQGTDPKVMIDQAMAQHKMKLDEIKTQAGLQHKEQKAQQGAVASAQKRALADLEAANKIRIDRAKAAASHTNGE